MTDVYTKNSRTHKEIHRWVWASERPMLQGFVISRFQIRHELLQAFLDHVHLFRKRWN